MRRCCHSTHLAQVQLQRTHPQKSDCVEVASLQDRTGLRASKAPDSPHLEFTPDDWRAFCP
ncbi:DUF397 domain-containing protein [Actinomadura keratinilytica]|uniref:DUF397 domain-containing protein n=1 Tax=Actinomadura keratinilytica TaxID=547461 RepID=UPI0031EAF609